MSESESQETVDSQPRSGPTAALDATGAPNVGLYSDAAAALSAAIESASALDHGRFLPGTILADRYRIVALVGRGGMGEVYRADDLKLQQSVALKFLPESLALLLIFPLTFDLSVWYAANAWLATAVVVAIALYAFHLATRGRWIASG